MGLGIEVKGEFRRNWEAVLLVFGVAEPSVCVFIGVLCRKVLVFSLSV